jgi:hypothetical protein
MGKSAQRLDAPLVTTKPTSLTQTRLAQTIPRSKNRVLDYFVAFGNDAPTPAEIFHFRGETPPLAFAVSPALSISVPRVARQLVAHAEPDGGRK